MVMCFIKQASIDAQRKQEELLHKGEGHDPWSRIKRTNVKIYFIYLFVCLSMQASIDAQRKLEELLHKGEGHNPWSRIKRTNIKCYFIYLFICLSMQASIDAQRKQEELLQKVEERRRMRETVVPTDDNEVRRMLRALQEPITRFGEREVRFPTSPSVLYALSCLYVCQRDAGYVWVGVFYCVCEEVGMRRAERQV